MESSEIRAAELGRQVQNQGAALSSLEEETNHLKSQLKSAEENQNQLATTLERVRGDLDRARIEAEGAAQAAIESARQQDLIYLVTVTGKDEMYEVQAVKLAETEEHARDLEDEILQMKEQEDTVAELLGSKEASIAELSSALTASERRVNGLELELTQLQSQEAKYAEKISDNDVLIRDLSSSINTEKAASEHKELLISTLRAQLQVSESRASELQQKHDNYVTAKDAEILSLVESHRSSEDRWHTDLDQAHMDAVATSERNATTLADLKGKLKRYQKEREERAQKFAEAQELSGRLMAIMGISKQQMASCGSRSKTPKHEKNRLPTSSGPKTPDRQIHRLPRSTNSSSGSSPKRIKTHQGSGSSFTDSPKEAVPMTNLKRQRNSTTRTHGIPLTVAKSKHNEAPSQPDPKQFSLWTNENAGEIDERNETTQSWCPDDESFSGGDLFTSTDQQQLYSTRRNLPSNIHDETTTDF